MILLPFCLSLSAALLGTWLMRSLLPVARSSRSSRREPQPHRRPRAQTFRLTVPGTLSLLAAGAAVLLALSPAPCLAKGLGLPEPARSHAQPVTLVDGTASDARPGASGRASTANPAVRDARYATREASAKEQSRFRGGDTTVVLGSSALVLILVVVLIVVLL